MRADAALQSAAHKTPAAVVAVGGGANPLLAPPALTAKGKRKPYRRRQHNYRPKNYRPQHIAECIGMDAIERRMGPLCRYLLTYIDEVSDYAIAAAVPRLNSKTAADFFQRCFQLTPFAVKQVVTDGGSEFKGDFDQLLKNSAITHLYTYPKSPKMNAVCERFNRTIQEQFVDFHEHLLFEDLPLFNQKLADWLVQFFPLPNPLPLGEGESQPTLSPWERDKG